jgi:transposase
MIHESGVLFACEGRGQHVIGRFADDFHANGGDPDGIRKVSMDMSPAFIASVREALPKYDRFHIMKLANEALDRVRKEEARENPHLKGSRFLRLRHPRRLTADQQRRLSDLRSCTHKTNSAYALVLGLRTFFELETHQAEAYLKRWYQWARSSRIEEMKRFAQRIKRHWSGVLRFQQSRITTGFLEGINSSVQAAKRKARGYRPVQNLITMIYLIAGKLDYQLTHTK